MRNRSDYVVTELGGKPASMAGVINATELAQSSQASAQSPVQCTTSRGKPEITRFKGLGEISPKEFAQFIGKKMRLSKIEYATRAESGPIFNLQSLIQNYRRCGGAEFWLWPRRLGGGASGTGQFS